MEPNILIVLLIISFSSFLSAADAIGVAAPNFSHFAFSTPSSPAASPPLSVSDICGVTENRRLCVTSVMPFLHGGRSSPSSVLQAEIQAAVNHTRKAIAKAKELAKDRSQKKSVRKCLEQCLSDYDSAIDNFNSASEAVDSKDFDTLRTMASAVIYDLSDCDDAFAGVQEAESPLGEDDDLIHKLVDNCFDIANKFFH